MQFLFDVILNNSVLFINIKIHPYITGLEKNQTLIENIHFWETVFDSESSDH